MNKRIVAIASRGSRLALYQSEKVKAELERTFPGIVFRIREVKTKGDKILDVALSKIGDKGLFTKELEVMLLDNEADIAVHSLKDMPTELPEGLMLGGVLKRDEVCDALVSINGKKLHELDETDIVATSSLRRKAQLLNINGRIRVIDIRGNVDTRVKKMEEGFCTAMVMSAAGLKRLGMNDWISEILDPFTMMPAVSQGVIAIEIRQNDEFTSSLIRKISHSETFMIVKAERTFLHELEGGCQVPVGCYSEMENGRYKISGFVSNPDGSGMMRDSLEDIAANAEDGARRLALRFIEKGAADMIGKIRSSDNI